MKNDLVNVFWFRRDLRLEDNRGLERALSNGLPLLMIFVFDRNILDDLEDINDARVSFIHSKISTINTKLKAKGSTLLTYYNTPKAAFKNLMDSYQINKVFANDDYEPYARTRDDDVKILLNQRGIQFEKVKDHVILEPHEVLKHDGTPYVIFTPYSRKWHDVIKEVDFNISKSALSFDNFYQQKFKEILSLEEMGFRKSNLHIPNKEITKETLTEYESNRNYPAQEGTSRLGVHLRFGTVSIRKLASKAREKSDTYLHELIWREFYQMILWHFPRVVNENFKKKYNALKWRNNDREFNLWCNGQTGYPIVDAGMRQLNATGYMHNRVRMIVASFLTKHLLIDWRWGEAYFAQKLLDYELASNNGGWQWAAGTGTDAQPYFRIFNPESQTKKFDPDLKYIKKWVPEFQELTYPAPIVDHKMARERALTTYKKALDA